MIANNPVLVALIVFVAFGIAAVVLRVLLSGTTPPIRPRPGESSVAELTAIQVDGADLWLLIRGRNVRNPVLLVLHGGPGTAMIGIARRYQKLLEERFVVVQWDQRGAGLSGGGNPADLTLDRYLSDGREVTAYLKRRFNTDRILLAGHSWGSAFGYILAHRFPADYHAFFGISQLSNRNEERCYAATLERARLVQDRRAVAALETLGPPPYRNVGAVRLQVAAAEEGNDAVAGMLERYRWSAHLGGDSGNINIVRRFITDLLLHREYAPATIRAWMTNKSTSLNAAYRTCIDTMDLFAEGTDFSIPVFFLIGQHDLLTVPTGAEELMDAIRAPEKELIRFDAAHEIPWERTEEYQRAIIERAERIAVLPTL